MAYRVFDTKEECWVNEDGLYMSPDELLHIIKRSFFGLKIETLSPFDDRYVVHRDTGLYDKNNILILEGDYVKAEVSEDKTIVGVVIYAQELAAYVILCRDIDEYFSIGSDLCEYIEVIGNVFDGT